MKITGLIPRPRSWLPRAIHIYRLTMPLAYIGKKTKHVTGWTTFQHTALLDSDYEAAANSDIVVFARPVTASYDAAKVSCDAIRSRGAKIIYETDDDLTNRYRKVTDDGSSCIPFLDLVDAITVSTRNLAKELGEYTNKPIFVVPNHIEFSMFRKVSIEHEPEFKSDGRVNIMLTGTPTHGADWVVAYQAVEELMKERDDFKLLVGGYAPDYIDYSNSRIIHLPFREYIEYPKTLAEADIVICSIDPGDGFNRSKSAVKAIESWSAARHINDKGMEGGAAVIATESVVYNGTVKNGHNGLLVRHEKDEYKDAVSALLDDVLMRRKLQRRGYLSALRKHNIASGWTKFLSAYMKGARL